MKGHKKIGYVPPVKYRTKGVGGNDFRAKAYTDTLRENGLEINPDFFCTHTQTIADAKEDVFMHGASPERPTKMWKRYKWFPRYFITDKPACSTLTLHNNRRR